MKLKLVILLLLLGFNTSYAIENISLGLAINYLPTSDLEIGEFGDKKETTYDNLFGEFGIYLGMPLNFRVGPYYSYYSKTIAPETSSETDISIWGIGVLADYGYELTESGTTFFVLGVESGYVHFTDTDIINSNTEVVRKTDSMRIGGFAGLRFQLSSKYDFELDYIYNISTFNHNEFPKKHYDYSGSSVRISLNYILFANSSNEGGDS